MPRRALPLALTLSLAAGAAAVAAPPRRALKPTVVVAVADSGINPYHEAFHRPRNTAHPCTYVAGFSCQVPALRLSVGKYKDYAKAVAADREVWDGVEPHQWYWIPGTNIIGAVCDGDAASPSDTPSLEPRTCILDENGHGTGTASSVISESPDALLLVHEGNSGAHDLKTAPVVADVQSHSWGPPAPLPLHAADPVLQDFDACSPAQRRPESLFFIAAGNEAPFPAILDCERQPADVHVVGGGYPGHWTPASWSTYDFASWFCRPAAVHTATKGTDEHCGTSFAAPTAAGAAAEALLRLRRQDRYTGRSTKTRVSRTVTRGVFEQALRDAATYTPRDKFPQAGQLCTDYVVCVASSAVYGRRYPLPAQAPHVFWGYGWLDSTVTPAVISCVRGGACPQKPAAAKEWNDARMRARTASDEVRPFRPGPQRDAGSKGDAGDERRTALPIVAGRTYTGTLEPWVTGGDMRDLYTFRAKAGDTISVAAASHLHQAVPADVGPAVGCWYLHAPDGRAMGGRGTVPLFQVECDSTKVNAPPKGVRAPATGTYVLGYAAHNGLPKHDYTFTVTLGR